MAKDKGGDFDSGTVEDLKGMISKWVSIPFGVLVIFVSGSALNLIQYFLELKGQLGFEPIHQEFIKWGILFAYYGGILSGPIVDGLDTTISFIIAAIISGGGFVALAFFTTSASVGTLNVVLIVFLVIFVAFNCSIAYIAAITTIIKNFSRNVGSMIAAVMIAYWFMSPWFDTTIRHGYFEAVELKSNLIAQGIIQFVVFLLASFIVNENDQSAKLKRASAMTDRIGILIYAAICGCFVAVVYFICIVAENWRLGVFGMALVILVNFIALGFVIQALLGAIKSGKNKEDEEQVDPPRKHYCEMMGDIRFWCLTMGSFIVIGTGVTYHMEAASVAQAIGSPDLAESVDVAFWLSEAIAILGGGLISAIFVRLINGWLFAALAAFSSMLGFGFIFLAANGDFWFYLASFFIGAGVGGWWVVAPQILLDDAGKRSFEGLWGWILTTNAFGMFCFEMLFKWVSEKTEPSEPAADCKDISCFLIPYVISGALCLIAGILALVGFNNDEGTGGAGGERKSLRKNDHNAKSDRKSRDKSSKRSKSKDKSKPREKSKSKSRSKSKN